MDEEKMVVDKFIREYDMYFFNWVGDNYESPNYLPPKIKSIIYFLTEENLVKTKIINDWRSVEEFPESLLYQDLIYSIVNLIINNNDSFFPDGIKDYISEYKDSNFRKKLLKSIYYKTYSNILNLNTTLNTNLNKSTNLVSEIYRKMENYNRDTFNFQSAFEFLYNSKKDIFLFSGVNQTILSNSELLLLMTQYRQKDFPIRSWTIDLRVAMQFTSSRTTGERHDPRISALIEIPENGKTLIRPFRVIFVTKIDKVCYVSPKDCWEAEILMPYSTYEYDGFFTKEIQFYNPPYPSDEKVREKQLFLFIIIKKIIPKNLKKINLLQFEKLTDNLYNEHLKITPEDAFKDNDDDLILDKYKRDRSRSRNRPVSRSRSRSRDRPVSRSRSRSRSRDGPVSMSGPMSSNAKGKKILTKKRRPIKNRKHTKKRRLSKKRRPTKTNKINELLDFILIKT
tara:strand:- start:1983 stop:3341 length:1359 start_codon:yes stop_codon:yes gene_type:complete